MENGLGGVFGDKFGGNADKFNFMNCRGEQRKEKEGKGREEREEEPFHFTWVYLVFRL